MRRETMLKKANDDWYVRTPDGKILHAPNTKTVRKNIDRGRIPLDSTVRRSEDEEWVTLAWTAEFADLVKVRSNGVQTNGKAKRIRRKSVPKAPEHHGASTRLHPHRLETVAVRTIVPELLAALESAVMRRKLVAIAVLGLILGGLFALSQYPLPDFGVARLWVDGAIGVAALYVTACVSTLLTRTTFVELSRLRPAKPAEVQTGWAAWTMRLFIAQLLVVGFAVGLILLLRGLPEWLLRGEEPAWQIAANVATAVVIAGEVVLWPVVVLTLLLAPIVVVEQTSVESGLARWLGLLRRYPGSVLLYEVLAVGVGLLVALVPALPLLFLGQAFDEHLTLTAATTRNVLLGLPAALLFAYLTVANVFIYLNLRYETR